MRIGNGKSTKTIFIKAVLQIIESIFLEHIMKLFTFEAITSFSS